ncbi:hypothetical protein DPMN_095560 [Dreissena polymorpha]|uniref:Uncharacterized protein n=1 Tax=Dreissena polymorpha TaxID=45954 RepID=A0A9D4R3Y1_DREPO|nr:hypothetical protein DPMN_095560 [Dreissena polymorpha]
MNIENKELYLPYKETVDALNRWFKEQKVNKFSFIKAVYKVMSKQSAIRIVSTCREKATLERHGSSGHSYQT